MSNSQQHKSNRIEEYAICQGSFVNKVESASGNDQFS